MLDPPGVVVSIAQSRTAPLQLCQEVSKSADVRLFQSLNREQPLCNVLIGVTPKPLIVVSIAQSRTAPLQRYYQEGLAVTTVTFFNRSIANSPSATLGDDSHIAVSIGGFNRSIANSPSATSSIALILQRIVLSFNRSIATSPSATFA